MILRAATPLDAGALGVMIGQAVAANSWKPQLHSAAEDIAHAAGMIAKGWVTVCAVQNEVVGFLARDGAEVHALYVGRDAQNKGVGTRLLEDAKAHQSHLTLWTFAANTGARRFYQRHGFEEAERTAGDNEEGLPDIRFVWHKKAEEMVNG